MCAVVGDAVRSASPVRAEIGIQPDEAAHSRVLHGFGEPIAEQAQLTRHIIFLRQ